MRICFCVYGKVQGVMFRKSFCLAAKIRGFKAGATNDKLDRERVICSIYGERVDVEKFLNEIVGKELNSWGAEVDRFETLNDFQCLNDHDVTTDDVDETLLNKIKIFI